RRHGAHGAAFRRFNQDHRRAEITQDLAAKLATQSGKIDDQIAVQQACGFAHVSAPFPQDVPGEAPAEDLRGTLGDAKAPDLAMKELYGQILAEAYPTEDLQGPVDNPPSGLYSEDLGHVGFIANVIATRMPRSCVVVH